MSSEVVGPRSQSGFATLWNMIVAPSVAFEALRERPTWVVALVFTVLSSTLTAFLMEPTLAHILSTSVPAQMAADPRMANLTAQDRERAVSLALAFVRYAWIWTALVVLFTTVVITFVLMAAAAAGRGTVSFARQFALSANVIALWYGIGEAVRAAIIVGRGPDAFSNPLDINLAIPCLAWLAPSAPPKILGFLAGITPFSVWAFLLIAAGMVAVSRASRGAAYAAATVVVVGECCFIALSAR